jgi:hypothetical protein
MEAFELRLWDGRLGRWLTTDPKHQYASPYLGMGNNPISRIDPDGGTDGVDIIDIEKSTGNVTITKAAGDDVVRLVDNGKVLSQYLYGENGSFSNENRKFSLYNVNGEKEGVSFVSRNIDKLEEFYKFAAKSDVEFTYAVFHKNSDVGLVTTNNNTKGANVEELYSKILKIGGMTMKHMSHSHPGKYDPNNGWPAYPSSFNRKLEPIFESDPSKQGDRYFYNKLRKKFPNQIPTYFDIYVPDSPKIEVKYNHFTVIRK